MNVQFKKGVLELCVLVLVNKRDRYGYELVQEISHKYDTKWSYLYGTIDRGVAYIFYWC